MTARRGANHGTIRRWAVHRCRLIGDLKTGVPQPLTRRVHIEAGHTGHPPTRRTVDVARICWRQMHFAKIGGDRLHRLEPCAGGLVAAVQVTATALAQWE